jgi:ATP-binding cassette subfamily F protein uup
MLAPILILQDIHLNFGRTTVLDGAELSLTAGERLCVPALRGADGLGGGVLAFAAAVYLRRQMLSRVLRRGYPEIG